MPSFRGRIPDAQVWQLVAYVRSMSGLAHHRRIVAVGDDQPRSARQVALVLEQRGERGPRSDAVSAA